MWAPLIDIHRNSTAHLFNDTFPIRPYQHKSINIVSPIYISFLQPCFCQGNKGTFTAIIRVLKICGELVNFISKWTNNSKHHDWQWCTHPLFLNLTPPPFPRWPRALLCCRRAGKSPFLLTPLPTCKSSSMFTLSMRFLGTRSSTGRRSACRETLSYCKKARSYCMFTFTAVLFITKLEITSRRSANLSKHVLTVHPVIFIVGCVRYNILTLQ